MKAKRVLSVIAAAVMIATGLGSILYPSLTDARYLLTQRALAAQSEAVAADKSNTGGRQMPDGAVAQLIIDEIDLDAYVLEGTGQEILSQGPGHYEETKLPGEHGNSAIAGHRTMHGHPFRRLDELEAGDRIVTYTTKAKAVYKVVEVKRVDPSDVSVIAPTRDDRLTLTTCNPVGSARQRLVVVARLVR